MARGVQGVNFSNLYLKSHRRKIRNFKNTVFPYHQYLKFLADTSEHTVWDEFTQQRPFRKAKTEQITRGGGVESVRGGGRAQKIRSAVSYPSSGASQTAQILLGSASALCPRQAAAVPSCPCTAPCCCQRPPPPQLKQSRSASSHLVRVCRVLIS